MRNVVAMMLFAAAAGLFEPTAVAEESGEAWTRRANAPSRLPDRRDVGRRDVDEVAEAHAVQRLLGYDR